MPHAVKHDVFKILQAVIVYKTAHDGNSPDYRELMAAVGITSTQVMRSALRRMYRAGLIKKYPPGRRAIETTRGSWTHPPIELTEKGRGMNEAAKPKPLEGGGGESEDQA